MKTLKLIRLLSLLLVLASCNSSNNKVNVLIDAPFTGEAASYGKTFQQAITIALDEIKDNNVKNKINVLYQDNELSTAKAVNILQQEMARQRIDVVMPVSSDISLALAPICNKNKIVLLPPLADANKLSKAGKYVFRISPSSSFQAKILAEYATNLKFKDAAILYINDGWGVGLETSFTKFFQQFGGVIKTAQAVNPGQRDLQSILTKIKNEKPELLVLFLHPAETVPALKQIKELGLNCKIFGGDTFSNKALYQQKQITSLMQGIIFALPTMPDNSIFNKFNKLFYSKYHTNADINAAAARDAILLIADAIKHGATNGENIKDYFSKKTTSFQGASGLIKWDKNGDVNSKKYSLYIVRGNKYFQLN